MLIVAPGLVGLVGYLLELLVGVARGTGPGGVLALHVAVAHLGHVSRDVDRATVREGDDRWDDPLLPHLVYLLLEVGVVLVLEVGEAALLLQVLPNRLAHTLALGNLLGHAGELAEALFDLIERVDARLDGELAELVGVL